MKRRDDRRKQDDRAFKDPVCGMEVSRMTAACDTVFRGKTYYFCADVCLEKFQNEPERYVRSHRQHGFRKY